MKKQFILFYIFFWIALVLLFWCTNIDEMFYSIMAFYVGLPLCLLAISSFGVDKVSKYTHIVFIILALSYMLEEYVTFSLANMLEFHKLNPPELVMFIRAIAIIYIGFVLRSLFTKK